MKKLRRVLSHMLIVFMAVSQLGAAIPAYAAADDGIDPVITDQTGTEVTSETETADIEESTEETEVSSEELSSEEQETTESEELTEETSDSVEETTDELTETETEEVTDDTLEKDAKIKEGTEEVELLGSDVYIDVIRFPDSYFREYVRSEFDKDGDTFLSDDERKAVTKITLDGDLSNPRKICTSVEGIKYFPNLATLSLYNTKIESADLSYNTNLETLIIYTYSGSNNNPVDSDSLKEIDISTCKKLDMIKLPNNTQLTKVDVPSHLSRLTYLELDHTGITSFDAFKKSSTLKTLLVSGLGLSSLDLRNQYKLEVLHCSNNNLSSLNVKECGENLVSLNCSDNRLTEVDVSENVNLKKYDVHNNQLTKLDLQYNTKLTELDIRNNCLFYADLTNQNNLREDGFKQSGTGTGSTNNFYTLHVTPDQKTVDLSAIKQCDPFKFLGKRVIKTYPAGIISESGILTIPNDRNTISIDYRCRESTVPDNVIDSTFYIRFEVDKQAVPIKSTTPIWLKNATLCVPGGYAVGSSSLAPTDTTTEAFNNTYKMSFSLGEWIDADTRKVMSSGDQFKYWGHYLYHVRFTPIAGYCFDKSNLPPATNFKFYDQDENCIMKGFYSCLDGKGNLHVYAQSTDKYKCYTKGTKSYAAADGNTITAPELCSLGVTSQEKAGKAVVNVTNFAMAYLSEYPELLPTYWVKISESDSSLSSKHNKWVKMTDSTMEFTDLSNGSHVVYMYAGSSTPTSSSKSFYEKSITVQERWTVNYQYAGPSSIAAGALGKYNYSERIPAESIAPEPDPAKIADTDWTVEGWYLDSMCTNKYDFKTKLTKDNTTLYAKIKEKQYVTITYDRNGKDSSLTSSWPSNQRVYIGKTPKRPSDPITTDATVFEGWYTDTDCTKEFSFDRNIVENITIYAKWIDPSVGELYAVKVLIPNEKYPAEGEPEYLTLSTQHVKKGECAKIPDGNFDYTDKYGRKNIFKQWKNRSNGKVFDFYEPVETNYELIPEYVTEAETGDFYASFTDVGVDDSFYYNEEKNRYEHVYTGSAYRPVVEVRSAGQVLIPGVDYTIKYSNNTNVDKKGKPATVTITGKGRHKGKTVLQFYILPVNLSEKYEPGYFSMSNPEDSFGVWCVRIPEICVQSGSKIKPVIYYGYKVLGSKDYKLSNTGKIKEDTSVTITGQGNYTGMISNVPVKVLSKEDMKAKSLKVTVTADKTYDSTPQTLELTTSETQIKELTVKDADGKLLKESDDFTVAYDSNWDAGTAKVTVTPVEGSKYIGSVTKTFKIKPRKNADLTAETIGVIVYDPEEGAVVPSDSNFVVRDKEIGALQFGSDYTVKFTSNRQAGTGKFKVTFGNNYKGHRPLSSTFTINPCNYGSLDVKCADLIYGKKNKYQSVPIVTYNGGYQKGMAVSSKDYTVKYYDGETDITGQKIELAEGVDSKRIKVVVTGRHNFTADMTAVTYYNVTRAPKEKINLTKARIVAKGTNKAIPKQVYTGSSIMPKIDVQIKNGKKWEAVDPSNYTVVYANCLSKGTATIYVNGRNDAVGSKKATFKIVAKSLADFLLNPIF